MRSLKDEEIKKELKRRGVRKENIKIALELKKQLELLDGMVFPDNPRPFCFVLKSSHPGQCAAYGPNNTNDEERFYSIIIEDLSKNFKEGKLGLTAVAAHEVRHRLQLNFSFKLFSPEVADMVDDQFRSAIAIMEAEFNKKRQILINRGEAQEYIEHVLDPQEFDAEVVEKIVTLESKKVPLIKIVSIIKTTAP